MLFAFEGYSTHLVGGTMHYEHLGRVGARYKYKVVFTIYRDCIRAEAEYDPEIKVCIYGQKSKKIISSFDVDLDGVQRVDPVGQTKCPLLVDNVCLEKGTYTKEIILSESTDGYILKWERCCRNDQVNLPNEGGRPKYGQTYIGYIPPTYIVNSSPYFSEIPVPFMCLNDTTEIRNYAIDPDGDSLVYSFIKPYTGASNDDPNNYPDQTCKSNFSLSNIRYNIGFNETNPFGASGYATIDSKNGLTTFMSKREGNFAVAVQVKEYRKGVLLSTSILDLQILVFKCDPNAKPKFTQFKESHEIEAGQELCFIYSGADSDPGDRITIKAIGDIFTGANGFKGTRATFAERSGTNTVGSQFCWNTDCDHAREEPYVFTIELIDDGCPPKFINKNVSIKVLPFISEVEITGSSPVCLGEEYEYVAIKGKPQSIFTWTVEGGIITSGFGTNTIKVIWTNGPGKLIVKETSRFACSGALKEKVVTMYPPVPSPIFTGKDSVCLYNVELYSAPAVNNISNYKWLIDGGSIVGNSDQRNIEVVWNRIGKGYLKLVQVSADGCESDTFNMDITTIKLNAPTIVGPVSICPNNLNEYYIETPNSSSTYIWFYNGVEQVQSNSDKIIIRFGDPAIDVVSVVEENSLKCKSDTGKLRIKVDHDLDGQIPELRDEFCVFTANERYYVVEGISSTYEWKVDLGTLISGQGNHEIYTDWNVAGNGYVSVIENAYDSVNKQVCISKEMFLPIIVHPKPDTKGITGDMDLCQMSGMTTDFGVTGFANSTFNWSFNGDASKVINQGDKDIKYPLDESDTFLIQVVEVSEFGCLGDRLDSLLYIRPRPNADLILGDAVVCFPDITNKRYSLQGFEGSTYEWWIKGGEFVSIDSNLIVVNWFNNNEGQLSILETSFFGCVGDTIKLDVWIDNPSLKLDVISVLPPPLGDDGILLKWNLINGERYDNVFLIQRRDAGSTLGFQTVGQVAGSIFQFIDQPINTDSNAFEYRILGKDLCGNDLISDVHTNTLLRGTQPEAYSASLNFTDYLGWQNGVSIYQYHRLLTDKTPYEWYYDALESNTAYFDNGLEHFTQCYRVKATELGGTNEVTWSNEVCFNYEPVVFAPNAFTPNNVGPNDSYFVVAGSFKTINLAIYNRWGEKLFETQDINVGWDGTYNGKPVSQGVFIYSLDYTSYDDTPYRQKGTITLLK